ncbi:PLP-dependent aminotransferase family protein [Thalassospira sp.]|uniref:aminotransferase-like domain-containing protein n=1 Tax=Thalassospira sp. TaxID=1912094 RepID=UPI002735B971|nr:PLP-dependent aminotransferase family protein [Thalassospira sp.]MDP2698158.1 PLP-dependent aminotransferase family protein [Thalassospira sp.]
MTMSFPELPAGNGPVYRKIAHAIRNAVEQGQLRTGDRLPTHRDLAYHLGVTVGTVTRAYREAERLGLAAGEVGRGTYILGDPGVTLPMMTPQQAAQFSNEHGKRSARDDVAGNDNLAESGPINFRMNCPLPPRENHIRDVLGDMSRTVPLDDLIAYKTEYGMPHHRRALASMAGKLGLDDNPERILPTAGVQHGMTVSLMTIVRPGDLVLCEELTYPNLRSLAAMVQFRLRGITMDDEGICPDALELVCRTQSPRAIYLMPTLHNPLCCTMSHERRMRIAEILRKYDLILIEDGIYSFLNPDAPPPLSCFVPERAIYLDGVSKSVGGGLRVGYIHAPIELTAKLASGIRTTCWMASGINVELVSRLIQDGSVARYEAWHREEAARRLGVILGTLKGYDVRFHPTNYHIWLTLPTHIDTSELVMNAANNGVLLTAAQQFAVGIPPRGLRLSFGAEQSTERLKQGALILDRLMQTSEFSDAAVM